MDILISILLPSNSIQHITTRMQHVKYNYCRLLIREDANVTDEPMQEASSRQWPWPRMLKWAVKFGTSSSSPSPSRSRAARDITLLQALSVRGVHPSTVLRVAGSGAASAELTSSTQASAAASSHTRVDAAMAGMLQMALWRLAGRNAHVGGENEAVLLEPDDEVVVLLN
jgi:hypothetical protein